MENLCCSCWRPGRSHADDRLHHVPGDEPGGNAAVFGTWVHTWGCNMPMALCWQMLYCGPLSRAIFRLLFRRGEKKVA